MTDIQAKLDEWLAGNPDIQKYVAKLWYVPEGAPVPADATHTLRLGSQASAERHLLIAIVPTKAEFAALLDALLAMIATQPGTRSAETPETEPPTEPSTTPPVPPPATPA